MKNSHFPFVNVVHLAVVASLIFCLSSAEASDSPQTKPSDAKVNPVTHKKTDVSLRHKKVQQPAAKKYSPSEMALRTALKQQIWLAQHKKPTTGKGNQPTPASKSVAPLSHNVALKSTRAGLHKFTPMPRYGVKPPQPLGGRTVHSSPPGGTSQDTGKSGVETNAVVSRGPGDVRIQDESAGSAGVFLILVALCMASVGTAAVLYLISKRASHKIEARPVRPAVIEQPQRHQLIPLIPERKPLERIGTFVSDADEKESAVVEMAQRYQRGQGEMQLLFNLQAHENDEASLANFIPTFSLPKARENMKKRAKKIGLGKGEVELLMRLQKYSSSANHTQRML